MTKQKESPKSNLFCFFQDWATPHWRCSPTLTLQVFAAAPITVTLLSCLGIWYFPPCQFPHYKLKHPPRFEAVKLALGILLFLWHLCATGLSETLLSPNICMLNLLVGTNDMQLNAVAIPISLLYWCGCHCTAGCKCFYFTVHMRTHLGLLGEYSQVIRVRWETMTYFSPALPLTNCDRQSY